jgi:hypothetical protein
MMAVLPETPPSQPYPIAQLPFAQPPMPPPPLAGTGPNGVYSAPAPAMRMFEDGGVGARMADNRPAVQERKRRTKLVIGVASAIVVLGIAIAMLASGGGKSEAPPPLPPKAEVVQPTAPVAPEHAIAPVAAPIDAAVAEVVAPAPDAPASTDCAVEIVSVPKDVEIAIDNTTKIGTAPGTVQLPCGVEVKLYLRKPGYAGVVKSITPAPGARPLRVVLSRAQFVVKVSSTPAGATISVAGKPVGITPTAVRLNGYEPVSIAITKSGYVTQEQKLTPKQQNAVVHVRLVPKPRSR